MWNTPSWHQISKTEELEWSTDLDNIIIKNHTLNY